MREIEINLADAQDVESRIDTAIAVAGLLVTMKGTLKSYPGCVHWHLKRGREPGTLEITWWPKETRAWFKIGASRGALWIDDVVPTLKHQIESNRSSNA